jgi:hypothetical protein
MQTFFSDVGVSEDPLGGGDSSEKDNFRLTLLLGVGFSSLVELSVVFLFVCVFLCGVMKSFIGIKQ